MCVQVGDVSELLPALTHAKQNGLKLALHLAEVSTPAHFTCCHDTNAGVEQ